MHERDILLCSVVVGPLLVAWLQSKRRLLGASTLSPCLIIIRSVGVIQVIIWRRRVGFVDGKFFWPFLLEEWSVWRMKMKIVFAYERRNIHDFGYLGKNDFLKI